MIKNGSTAIIETIDAFFSPCVITSVGDTSYSVRYMQHNFEKKTSSWKTEVIAKKNIRSIIELI